MKNARTDLSYFNARVRGFKGRLLKKSDYEPLLKAEDLGAVMDMVRSTAYGPYIDAAAVRFARKEEAFPSALKSSLVDAFELIWRIAPGCARPFVKAVFTDWEVLDLKGIVRGIARGVKREEIREMLIPAGEFDTAALDELLTSRDVPDLIRFLDTWGSPHAKPLKAGLPAFKKDGRITEMEIALDKHSNQFLFAALGGDGPDSSIMRGWMSLRVDLVNVLTLFKVSGEGYSDEGAGDFFVEGGGALRRNDFIRMAGLRGREELIEALRGRVTDVEILRALASADPKDPLLLEERVENALERRLAKHAIVEPLSMALAGSFIYMKVRETKNLLLVGRGKSFGMPEDEIRRLVIYPSLEEQNV